MTAKQLTALQEKVNKRVPELQARLRICTTDLSREDSEHSELFGEVADLYAECYVAHIQFIQRVKELREGLSLRIRQHPERHGLTDKFREGDVTSIVETNPMVLKIKHRRNTADGLRVRLDGLKEAYSQRRSMLNNEVDLKCRGAQPSIEASRNDQFAEDVRELHRAKKRSVNKG